MWPGSWHRRWVREDCRTGAAIPCCFCCFLQRDISKTDNCAREYEDLYRLWTPSFRILAKHRIGPLQTQHGHLFHLFYQAQIRFVLQEIEKSRAGSDDTDKNEIDYLVG